jgi:general secretion pathway protein H
VVKVTTQISVRGASELKPELKPVVCLEMETSATFIYAKIRQKWHSRGFTLIEMLVVVMVMGLLIGLVSVSLRPDERGLLKLEADRLAQLLTLATEEARLTGKTIRWMADAGGYKFSRLRPDGEWSEIRDNDLLRARNLPQAMTISGLRIEAGRSLGVMRLEFPPYGSPLVFAIDMSLGAERTTVISTPIGDMQVQPGTREANAKAALQ